MSMLMLKRQQGPYELSLLGVVVRWMFVIFNLYMAYIVMRMGMFIAVVPAEESSGLVAILAVLFIFSVWGAGASVGWFALHMTKPRIRPAVHH